MELAKDIVQHVTLFLAKGQNLERLHKEIDQWARDRYGDVYAGRQANRLKDALAIAEEFPIDLATAIGWTPPVKDSGDLVVLALRAARDGTDTRFPNLFEASIDWTRWKGQPDLQVLRGVFERDPALRTAFARAQKVYPGQQHFKDVSQRAVAEMRDHGNHEEAVKAVLKKYLLNWDSFQANLQDAQFLAALSEDFAFRQTIARATGYQSEEAKDLASLATEMLRPMLAPGKFERLKARLPLLASPSAESRDAAWRQRRDSLINRPGGAAVQALLGALTAEPDAAGLQSHLAAEFARDPDLSLALWKAMRWPYPFALVLREELKQIEARRRAQAPGAQGQPQALPEQEAAAIDVSDLAARRELVGLAFSGGGIRSATFNLGVLQKLAEFGLLRKIDYLSTVSGGGYIGAWLAGWIKREKIAEVESLLSPTKNPDPRNPSLEPIRFLREFSNYLTPTLGTFSFDTWTMVAVYLRNVSLNQATLFALLGALMLLPRFLGLLMTPQPHMGMLDVGLGFVGCITLFVGFGFISKNLSRATKSVRERDAGAHAAAQHAADQHVADQHVAAQREAARLEDRRSNRPEGCYGTLWVQISVVACLLTAALLGSLWFWRNMGDGEVLLSGWHWLVVVGLFVLLWGSVAGFGGFWSCYGRRRADSGKKPGNPQKLMAAVFVTVPCALLSLALLWAFLRIMTRLHHVEGSGVWTAEIWGPVMLLAVLVIPAILQIGLMGVDFPDSGREWLSRLHAVCSIYTLYWVLLLSVAIYGPFLVLSTGSHIRAWVSGLTFTWVATTVGSFLAGSSKRTGRDKEGKPTISWLEVLAKVGPPVFIAGLLVFIATLEQLALAYGRATPFDLTTLSRQYWLLLDPKPVSGAVNCHLLGAFLCLLFAAGILVWRVDINEFSMHHFYKNRLVRCYLGASHQPRNPNPFTGFDDLDDFALSDLRATGMGDDKRYSGPYPIINTTLNLSAGKELAWQERKASSFIFTPCFCGFDLPRTGEAKEHLAGQAKEEKLRDCAYRDTIGYGERYGLRMGTAVSISGAAANPNQGYNTSPAVAFLMTMFDVRLGWWMGNPRRDKESGRSSPYFGLAALVSEMIGRTDDRTNYINLSDGGHFDNMGIYELVRRRCRFILLCDAEEDGQYKFGGLGMAIRKCRVDFGAKIRIDPSRIAPKQPGGWSDSHCAVGKIEYLDGSRGTLVYIKASLTGDEPEDVTGYHAIQKQFPHESTADQWFDESQFESYRALGYHAANRTLSPSGSWNVWKPDKESAKPLFNALEDYWYPMNPHLREGATKHTSTLAELLTHIQSNPGLHELGAQLFPTHGIEPENPRDPVQEFYFCMALIQLVEDLYFEFELDREEWLGDPRIGGWRELFRTWKSVPTVALTWEAQHQTFRKDFQHFWRNKI